MKKVSYFLFGIALIAFACTGFKAPSFKMGIALYSFNQFAFADAINKADSAGVKYVEGFSFHNLGSEFGNTTLENISDADISKVKSLLDKKGIKMTSMYAGNPPNAAGWKRDFEIAKAIGMSYIVCEPEKKDWDLVDSLCNIYKIKIAIHEHAKGLSAYWHPDSVLAAIKGHPNFNACADIGHWTRSGLDPVKCLQQLKGHILGLHLKDVDESGNKDAADVNPGTGVIKFKEVFTELQKQNFSGMAFVEFEHDMDNNLSEIKDALVYFNKIATSIK